MVAGWAVILSALVYLCLLFAVAYWGDNAGRRVVQGPARSTIAALSLAVYCTSWTFFGSVGLASRSGFDFLTIYIGPILVIGLGHVMITRVVRVAKTQNISSIADFVAARYGKSERVAAIVSLIALIGSIPYIALQLKAVSSSLDVFLTAATGMATPRLPIIGDLALIVAVVLAGFAVAFGTRHTDATEHQDGLMMAVSIESVVKLVAFLLVGGYVTFVMFDGYEDIVGQLQARGVSTSLLERTSGFGSFMTLILLSSCAALLLPRQFHMTVVENRSIDDLRRAAWLFPLYLVLINIFVIPIALGGMLLFPSGTIDRDMTVLALPLFADAGVVAIIAFLGGFSAATAMVIVDFGGGCDHDFQSSRNADRPATARIRRRRSRWLRDRRPSGFDLRGHPPRLCLLSCIRGSSARVHRPPVVRRHGSDRARLHRRLDLVPWNGSWRQRGSRCRICHLGLHAPAPEPGVGRCVLVRRGRDRTLRHHGAQADGFVRCRPPAAHPRSGLEPHAQHPRLCGLLPMASGERDGAHSGKRLCGRKRCFGGSELPPVSSQRHRRRVACNGCSISR